MIIHQTVEIPAKHRLVLEVPQESPVGRTIPTFTPDSAAENSLPAAADPSLSIEALKRDAAQKAARCFADPSKDALQQFCGSLAHIYTEDGVITQRRMRDEWER
ncbi:hypothetical protein ACYULU_11610 [Breznakiellaceae bacterium SP9]